MRQSFSLSSYWVYYDDQEVDILYGVQHLQFTLSPEEGKVFIDSAMNPNNTNHEARFEDRYGRNYALIYNIGDSSFQLNCLGGY